MDSPSPQTLSQYLSATVQSCDKTSFRQLFISNPQQQHVAPLTQYKDSPRPCGVGSCHNVQLVGFPLDIADGTLFIYDIVSFRSDVNFTLSTYLE